MKKLLYVMITSLLVWGCVMAPAAYAAGREVKVAIVLDYLGDLSYNDGIVREMFRAEKQYQGSSEINLSVKVYEMKEDTGDMKSALETACNESDLILVATQLAPPVLEPAAAYFSDKKFILIDVEATGANVYSALFKPNEAAFMCGALAALMSKTGMVGIVIGQELPALYDFCVGYVSGAREIDPNCVVIVSSVGNFYDEEKGHDLAVKQFERGADICFGVAGRASLGCIRAAHEHGLYAIGVDVDQTEYVVPELRDVIITSCLKNFEILAAVTLKDYLTGALKFGESGRLGLKEGAVGIARNQFYLNAVPEDVRDKIDDLEEKIRSGEIKVRSAYEMTKTEIEELLRSARRRP